MYEIEVYVDPNGREVFREWLTNLNDRQAKVRITNRIARVAVGNFGDARKLGDGAASYGLITARDTGSITRSSIEQ